jgi:hypothetical protein
VPVAPSQAAASGASRAPEKQEQVDPVPAAPSQAAASGASRAPEEQGQVDPVPAAPLQAAASKQQAQETEEQRVLPAGVIQAAVVPAFAPPVETTYRRQSLQV